MVERGSDRLGLCLKTAVLSVCSLCLIMFFFLSLSVVLIIDPAGSVGLQLRPGATLIGSWC